MRKEFTRLLRLALTDSGTTSAKESDVYSSRRDAEILIGSLVSIFFGKLADLLRFIFTSFFSLIILNLFDRDCLIFSVTCFSFDMIGQKMPEDQARSFLTGLLGNQNLQISRVFIASASVNRLNNCVLLPRGSHVKERFSGGDPYRVTTFS